MQEKPRPRILCLSNMIDQHYHDLRGEKVSRCLTIPYRSDLFDSLEAATGREVVVLSSPPKTEGGAAGKWLSPVETKFAHHRQLFCANWDVPKLRIPLAWIFYAGHVLRQTRSGDLVVMDNYEFLYVFAARFVQIFRKVRFVLVYLDGKHLIDRGWNRILSGLAELWGRRLLTGAILSNPALGKRLPESMPKELVPGFIRQTASPASPPNESVRLLYAGTLAGSHGIDLLLEAVKLLPEHGWHLVVAGQGPMTAKVDRLSSESYWNGRLTYLPTMSPDAFQTLLQNSHVGLNCQRASDPISSATFPSKIFTYLSASLLVISSKSGCVEEVCGNACLYYDSETPQALAAVMSEVIANFATVRRKLDRTSIAKRYSMETITARLKAFLQTLDGQDEH
jgi:glycosyltransferase involved in cell wall biosynthesis